MPRRLTPLLPPLILLALVLIILRGLAFTDLILGRGDTFVYFYPYWAARDAFFQAGALPLWTPNLFTGAPLLANPQVGALYPPNWLTIGLSAPDAIRVSVLLHTSWAALGAYLLARRGVGMSVPAALVTGATYGLGGYVGAHTEQINQLQGLSWFPWAFWVLVNSGQRSAGQASGDDRKGIMDYAPSRQMIRGVLILGIVLALQFLAGHTQTVFICGVGLAVYTLAAGRPRGLLVISGAGVVALALASPQLIPTLELIGESGRSGGLTANAALSFSFNPFIAARGLLPSYDGKLFTEYIAYVGVAGVFLAVVGVIMPSPKKNTPIPSPSPVNREQVPSPFMRGFRGGVFAWVMLAVMGLFLALGAYNPVNWLLVQLPGFDLFRVPARWLALYALAVAVLAGVGVEQITKDNETDVKNGVPTDHHHPVGAQWRSGVILFLPTVVIFILIALSFLAGRVPEDINGAAAPTVRTLATWGGVLAVMVGIALTPNPLNGGREQVPSPSMGRGFRGGVIVAVVFVELIAASWVMPYNDLIPPEAWSAGRFTAYQLAALTETDPNGLTPDGTPPGRLLSVSGLFFDPGDQAAISARYAALNLTPLQARYGFVAAKLYELLSPNLPLAWDIPTIDGFGGGLLPTRHYIDFMALAYPDGAAVPVDGRLRENLVFEGCRGACFPRGETGELLDLRYFITDKTFDIWHEGVAFDTNLYRRAPADYVAQVPYVADAIQAVYRCEREPCAVDGLSANGTPAAALTLTNLTGDVRLVRGVLPLAEYDAVTVAAGANLTVLGVSLVDTRFENQFVQLTPPEWTRILSSDIKVYHYTRQTRRAYVGEPYTDPQTIIAPTTGSLTWRAYQPTRLALDVESGGGTLVLSEAYYPGWQATVNGESVPVYRGNVNFRAISLQAGSSRVIFDYKPGWLPGVFVFGGIMWVFVSISTIVLWRRK